LRSLARLAYSILFVADLERSIRFYRDTIGLPFRFASDTYAEFATVGAKFGLYARPQLPELIGRSAPTDAVPWPQGEVAFFVDDPDAEHERLRRAGVDVLAPPTTVPGESGPCTWRTPTAISSSSRVRSRDREGRGRYGRDENWPTHGRRRRAVHAADRSC
jgi:lactoylglutathione lyase